jgi:hypothetical protein
MWTSGLHLPHQFGLPKKISDQAFGMADASVLLPHLRIGVKVLGTATLAYCEHRGMLQNINCRSDLDNQHLYDFTIGVLLMHLQDEQGVTNCAFFAVLLQQALQFYGWKIANKLMSQTANSQRFAYWHATASCSSATALALQYTLTARAQLALSLPA